MLTYAGKTIKSFRPNTGGQNAIATIVNPFVPPISDRRKGKLANHLRNLLVARIHTMSEVKATHVKTHRTHEEDLSGVVHQQHDRRTP
jgi:hypothetical protein